jgi:hypothetical protein
MTADRVREAPIGNVCVALAFKIVAYRIVTNCGAGIVIDFRIAVYFIPKYIAYARIVASDIAANVGIGNGDPPSAVLNLDIAANCVPRIHDRSKTLIGVEVAVDGQTAAIGIK